MSQAPGPGNQFTRQRSERSAPTNRDQDDLDQSFEQMIAPESSKPTKTTRINGDQVEVLEVDHHLGAHIQGVMAQEQMLAGDSQFFNICDDPLSATISRECEEHREFINMNDTSHKLTEADKAKEEDALKADAATRDAKLALENEKKIHPRAVKLFIFDFDQTLSVIHVFKQLAGWEHSRAQFVAAPYAISERGQVDKVRDLAENHGHFAYVPADEFRKAQLVSAAAETDGGAGVLWSTAALGGAKRIEKLRECFEGLRNANAALCICTKGYVDTVREVLSQNDLEKYFFRFYGRNDAEYTRKPGMPGPVGIPLTDEPTSKDPKKRVDWSGKGHVVQELRREFDLDYCEVVFADDDGMEISLAQPFCRTMFVEQREGLSPEMLDTLKALSHHPVEPQRRPWNTHQTIAPYLNQLAKKRASQNNTSSVSTRNSQSNVNNNNMSDPKRQDTSLDHEDAESTASIPEMIKHVPTPSQDGFVNARSDDIPVTTPLST